MKALILAAGLGTRLRPDTLHLAKPAIRIHGLPLIAFPLHLIEGLGVSEIFINTHYLPETVHEAVQELQTQLRTPIQYSHESPDILGSGGALKPIRDKLINSEHILVANADTLLSFSQGRGLEFLVERHKKEGALATLLTCNHPDLGVKIGGVWSNSQGRVVAIGKSSGKSLSSSELKTALNDSNIPFRTEPQSLEREISIHHYTGYMILREDIFKHMAFQQAPCHIFTDILVPAIQRGEKVISHWEALEWFETGDQKSLNMAKKACLNYLESKEPSDVKGTYERFQVKEKN